LLSVAYLEYRPIKACTVLVDRSCMNNILGEKRVISYLLLSYLAQLGEKGFTNTFIPCIR
jgi:hypothetical protein